MTFCTLHREVANVNGIDLFYRDTRDKNQVILCLHGRWGRGETWIDFIQHYHETYRIIAPDLRGHGLSGKPKSSYTAAEMAADLVELLNKLGVESVILVGHSMGGHIAGYFAATYPQYVQSLAILDKSAAGPTDTSEGPVEDIDPITKDWPLPFSSLAEAKYFIRKDMDSELSYNYFMNSLHETIDGYQMMFSAQAIASNIAHYSDWYSLLSKIECPVMLVKANNNDAVPDEEFEKMQTKIRRCYAYRMTSPDHNVHLGNEEEFYKFFDDFLSKC